MPTPITPYAPGAPQETELSHLPDPSSMVDWGTPHNGPLDGMIASTQALSPKVPGPGMDVLSPDLRTAVGPPASMSPFSPAAFQVLGQPVAPGSSIGPSSGPMGPFASLPDQPATTQPTPSPGIYPLALTSPLESGASFGKAQAGGFDPIGAVLGPVGKLLGDASQGLIARDVTLPNLPARAADYLVGTMQGLVGSLLGQTGSPMVNAAGTALKAWQQDPNYWTALGQSTDPNMQAWSTKIANQYVQGDAGKALADSIYQSMKTDRQKMLGITSGDGTVDYQAKAPLIGLQTIADHYGTSLAKVIELYAGGGPSASPDLTGATGSVAGVLGIPSSGAGLDSALGLVDLLAANPASYQMLGIMEQSNGAKATPDNPALGYAIGNLRSQHMIGVGPSVLGDLQASISPLDPRTDALWQSLSVPDRQALLQLSGGQNSGTMAVLMAAAMFSGGGLVASAAPKLAEVALGRVIGSESAAVVADNLVAGAGFVRRGILAAETAGTTIMLASWAAEIAMPGTPIAGAAHSLDYSRPVSGSAIGAYVNLVGMFNSPREVLAPEIAAFRGAKSLFGSGMVDHPIILDSRGGADGIPRYIGAEIVPEAIPGLLENSQRNIIYSETQNTIRNRITNDLNAVGADPIATLGPRWLEMTPEDQALWKQMYANDAAAGLEGTTAAVVNVMKRAEQGHAVLSSFADDATRQEFSDAAGLARALEQETGRTATARQQSEWNLRLAGAPATVEALRADMAKTASDSPAIFGRYNEAAAVRRLGKSPQRWMAAATTLRDMAFAALNGELQSHIADSIKANPASGSRGLYMVDQNHVFARNADDLIAARNADTPGWAAAAERYMVATHEGQEFIARNPGVPIPDLAGAFVNHIAELAPVLIDDRALATDPNTVDLGLNRFHAELVANGRWTLAYKPEYAGPSPAEAIAAGYANPAEPPANVSYVRLHDGTYYAAPWIEYGPSAAGAIRTANGNWIARQTSNALSSFQAWRQQEFQRASLFGRLSPYDGITGAAMDRFHTDLLRRASQVPEWDLVRTNVQAQSILHASDIQRMGEEAFGSGPKRNVLTGRTEPIDYAEVVRNAYRQSVRLNATAAFTSAIKAALPRLSPFLAKGVVGTADVLNPVLRFEASPLFQVQIRLESILANVGHGVSSQSGDSAIRSVFGLERRYGSAADMAGTDQMMATMVTQGRNRGNSLALGRPLPPDAPLDVPGGQHAPPEPLAQSSGAAIQAAYDAGDIARGQELNRQAGIAAGGSAESGGAVKAVPNTEPPVMTAPAGEGDLGNMPGTPEHLVDVAEAWAPGRASIGKRAWDALMKPGGFKEQAAANLAIRNFRDFLAPIARAAKMTGPMDLFAKLGVPDREIADFIAQDRELTQRFYNSDPETPAGRAAEQALFDHAGKYDASQLDTADARGRLDAMYASPEWAAYSGLLRLVGEYAQKEAFGVHFFNSEQSFVARTLNHPVLGFYPGAWAYKVARQWFLFMYDNHTIPGMHLGMAPAVIYQQWQQAQASTFAMQNKQSLTAYLSGKTSLDNVLFWGSLVMPGTPDNIPFSLSKPARLVMKGDYNPLSWAQQYYFGTGGKGGAGLIRDLNGASELGTSLAQLVTGAQDKSAAATQQKLDAIISSSVRQGVRYTPAGMRSVVDYPLGSKIAKP